MSFLRQHVVVLSGISTSILLGAGATFLYLKLTEISRELDRLSHEISTLRNEFADIRNRLLVSLKRRKNTSRYSLATSSGEDDEEIFLDAHGGSDFESVNGFKEDVIREEEIIIVDSKEDDLFALVDQLFEGGEAQHEESYHLLLKSKPRHPTNVDHLWRLSKACYLVSRVEGNRGNSDKKKELLYMARDNAGDALKLDQENGDCHKWYAITLGSIGDYESTQVKIKNGFDIKVHIEKAILLKPDDPSNHHMLGRWCYSVYMLSWIERNLAATLFAAPPSANVDDALQSFLKAEKLKPNQWKENILFIGKCYIEKRNYEDATKWLEKGEQIAVKTAEDEGFQNEITKLLYKYRK